MTGPRTAPPMHPAPPADAARDRLDLALSGAVPCLCGEHIAQALDALDVPDRGTSPHSSIPNPRKGDLPCTSP